MNLENVNTEPFVNLHLFHEHINITIKILTASLHNTFEIVSSSNDEKELGKLIAKTDPAWNTPPIWSFSGISKAQIYGYVSEFGVIGAFSALDDFFEGVESEINRWNEKLDEEKKMVPIDGYDKFDEKVLNFYSKYNWKTIEIDKYIPLLKYFRLVRNCIAHRNCKPSSALIDYSTSDFLDSTFSDNFKNNTIAILPKFKKEEKVVIDPKLAIFSSHILRCISEDVNNKLIQFLGQDGVVNMAAHHGFLKEQPVITDAYKSAEAIFNFILTDRYRVILDNNREASVKAKNIGVWRRCLAQFEASTRNQ
ncbi:hypothetical protein [Pectobacterium carotovorum]|uniref:hypothetical protein n=1 Tax=Pectobacterium carotovorum TaxID=554 RepID=UPI0013742503|nr:hypothetical protein [Pectobacterium carotovorum]QHP57776.1 hypothetical protein EH204_07210 [Pectobacterium carotovorum subsp. carotovorum]